MSAVGTGLLRVLYSQAKTNTEYLSSEFWQHYLNTEFDDVQTYSVISEQAPDGSRPRVDRVVKRFDADHGTIAAMLWIDCKGPDGDIAEVERQALDAARRCVAADSLLWIYAMTTIGTAFRVWFYEKDAEDLTPFHGEKRLADRTQYIDADSGDAWVLPLSMDMVRKEIPSRAAPSLASQQSPAGEEYYSREFSSSAPSYMRVLLPADDVPAYDTNVVRVQVQRTARLFHQDDYIFVDTKGYRKTTTKNDWEQAEFNGEIEWVYYGRKTVYVSDIQIQ